MKTVLIVILAILAIALLIIYFGTMYFILELAKACCIKESEDHDADEETDRK